MTNVVFAECWERDWKPLEGSPEKPPPGRVWEAVVLASDGVVASGSTRAEALDRLQRLIERRGVGALGTLGKPSDWPSVPGAIVCVALAGGAETIAVERKL